MEDKKYSEIAVPGSNYVYVLEVTQHSWQIRKKVFGQEPDYANPITSLGNVKKQVRDTVKLEIGRHRENLSA